MAFTEPTETLINYPLNGSNRRFTIPFDYLQRSFIRVSLFAANKEEQLTLGVDFNFLNDTTIETVKTYGGADGWQRIQLRRYTDAKRIVEFIDGSVLLAGDLNVATLQTMHIAQEGRDSAFDMLTVNTDGNYDAKARRIVRVANGVDDQDAVTMIQFKDWTGKVTSEADRAKREADRSRDEANRAKREGEAQVELAKKEVVNARNAGAEQVELAKKEVIRASAEADRAKREGEAQVVLAQKEVDNAKTEVNNAKEEVKRAKKEADRAEQAVVTALDPYRAEELTYVATGGETTLQLPFLPFNLLVFLDAAVQPRGYSYVLEGSMIKFAGQLLKGEVVYVLMNPPLETSQVIVSQDEGNMIVSGTDGGAKLIETTFDYLKGVSEITTEQVK